MNMRERILAGAVLTLAVLWGGKIMYGRYERALDARRAQVTDANTRLAEATTTLAMGRDAVRKMEQWQQRSLPTDREKALSMYKAWLLAKAKSAGLTVSDIKPAARTTASNVFSAIGYQIEATGTLSSVVSMLYEFYRSPQLQQITRLHLARTPGATQLQVTLEVEALCLPGAIATDSVPEGDAKRLKLASTADYQKSLGDRDLAAVYTPPRPPGPPPVERKAPPPPPKFDDSEFAMFTAAVDSGAGPQAWIHVRTTGEMLHLNAGDKVKIGALEGQIESVDVRSLVLKMGEKKYRVALGQSLRKGKELDANGQVKAEPATEPPKG